MADNRAPDRLDRPLREHLRHDFVALGADQTVTEALAHLRSQDLGERVVYFYVVDAEGKLVGVLPTRRLLMSAPDVRLATIMQRNVVSLPDSASLLLACELFVMHRLLALPVVGADGRLCGIVDIGLFTDEMFDLSERQSSEDVFQLIGVRLAQSQRGSPWEAFKRRFPWLLCNIAGGLVCAALASRYEAFLGTVVVLALFIPVVLALAESVSMQSMTLTLQALHQRRPDRRFLGWLLARELAAASFLGLAAGLLVGLFAYAWRSAFLVALAITVTIWLSVTTACLLGAVLPATVRAFRGDPKIAAGPIVLAVADVATLLLYLNLAALLLK